MCIEDYIWSNEENWEFNFNDEALNEDYTTTYIAAPVNSSKNTIGKATPPLWDPLRFLPQQQQQHRTTKLPNPINNHRAARIMPGSAV